MTSQHPQAEQAIPQMAGGAADGAAYRVVVTLLGPPGFAGLPENNEAVKYFDDLLVARQWATDVHKFGVRLENGVTFTRHGIRCVAIEGKEGVFISPSPAIGGSGVAM